MPKKTGRSARIYQAQRGASTGERKSAARPLIDVQASNLAANSARVEVDNSDLSEETAADAEVEYTAPTNGVKTRPASPAVSNRESAETGSTRPVGSSTRRPYGRRPTANTNRQPVLSREEEYAFIRSDLITVFLLTVLMIAILIILTFILGR
jgi:Tfp pilus assembly protein FimV